jgi:hypothetical protein
MHDYANDWFGGARAVAAPVAEPAESHQSSIHDGASFDVEAASLVRLYVLAYEHRTGQAPTTRHIGGLRALHGVELGRGAAR